MKKVNMYVVTYNNEERINQNIQRFIETTKHLDKSRYDIKYHIINNHSNFNLHPEFKDKVAFIFHNTLRPDFSCGHLSRDYNCALIHGFRNLNNPAVDQVICGHDDNWLHDGWFEILESIHNQYTFYAGDYGCSLTSYLPDAIKKIGIWDERFCNIGFHEADYFLRALIFNKYKSTINDRNGGRILNPTAVPFDHPPENINKIIASKDSEVYHTISRKVFADKWNIYNEQWGTRVKEVPSKPLIKTYMYYPYFERDIEDLDGKNYSHAKPGFENFLEEWK